MAHEGEGKHRRVCTIGMRAGRGDTSSSSAAGSTSTEEIEITLVMESVLARPDEQKRQYALSLYNTYRQTSLQLSKNLLPMLLLRQLSAYLIHAWQ